MVVPFLPGQTKFSGFFKKVFVSEKYAAGNQEDEGYSMNS